MDVELRMKCLEIAVKYIGELAANPRTSFPDQKVDAVKVAKWFYEYCSNTNQSVEHVTILSELTPDSALTTKPEVPNSVVTSR